MSQWWMMRHLMKSMCGSSLEPFVGCVWGWRGGRRLCLCVCLCVYVCLRRNTKGLKAFIDAQYDAVSRYLVRVIFKKYQLMDHMEALMRYLLLGAFVSYGCRCFVHIVVAVTWMAHPRVNEVPSLNTGQGEFVQCLMDLLQPELVRTCVALDNRLYCKWLSACLLAHRSPSSSPSLM